MGAESSGRSPGRGASLLAAILLLGGALHPTAARAQDSDGDGWTLAEGDCDDAEPTANPGYSGEVCGDRLDNDCNGFYDDGCDLSVRQGSLRGGGGCSGNDQGPAPAGTVTALALPVLGLSRRKRGAR